jgi:hypothetical protein
MNNSTMTDEQYAARVRQIRRQLTLAEFAKDSQDAEEALRATSGYCQELAQDLWMARPPFHPAA